MAVSFARATNGPQARYGLTNAGGQRIEVDKGSGWGETVLRYIFLFVAVVAVIALFTRKPGPRRVLYVTIGLMVVYTVLKLTGVVDGMRPDRMSVF